MKYRYSFQRELIYEEIKKSGEHLTADEIFNKVKNKHKKIGLGTIYRNLSILENEGKIKRLNVSSNISVYESELKPHHHLICKKCGDIKNVYEPATFKCVHCLSWVKDFKIEEAFINAFGFCKKCKK